MALLLDIQASSLSPMCCASTKGGLTAVRVVWLTPQGVAAYSVASPVPYFPHSLLARDVFSNLVGLLLEVMVESVLCCLQELTQWSPLCQHSLLQLLLAMHQPGPTYSEPHEFSAAGTGTAIRPLLARADMEPPLMLKAARALLSIGKSSWSAY